MSHSAVTNKDLGPHFLRQFVTMEGSHISDILAGDLIYENNYWSFHTNVQGYGVQWMAGCIVALSEIFVVVQ